MKKKNNGMALVMALVFAVVLLQMAVAYSGMTRDSKPQTIQLDERARLEFLARGLSELAILKFQLFPADFYACWEAASITSDVDYLNKFTLNANEFKFLASSTLASSSFNNSEIKVGLATMTLFTRSKWGKEALLVKTYANYSDQYGRSIDKEVIKIVSAERLVIK